MSNVEQQILDTTATTTGNKEILCKLHYKKICTSVEPAALSEVFSRLKSASILGGNKAGRFSYWAAGPKEVFEFRCGQEKPFEKLQQVLAKYKLEENSKPCPERSRRIKTQNHVLIAAEGSELKLPKGIFCGGWVGYFSYELGRYIEKIQQTTIDDLKMPLIRLSFYDKVICYDHIGGNCWLIALELDNEIERPQEKLARLEELIVKAKNIDIPESLPAELDNIDFSQIRCNMDRDYYLRTVEKIKRYIYDGEVYQINFSQRFECDYNGRPIELFGWQNRYNPSSYAAYIDSGDSAIVSASPEMFITVDDGLISTKPIKGTRRRINVREDSQGETNPQAKLINAKNFDELLRSEKEQAELNMIIDLERNDLARICEPGTRKVIQRRTIETYPTVFHAVATVEGKLRDGISFCDIIKAMFPGGSITGAPKVSAMKIIDETEPTARGVYTGSIGYIGIDGNACLNIAIRTIIITGTKAFVQAGGGIVADSDPEAEWDETITKARALLAGIRSVNE